MIISLPTDILQLDIATLPGISDTFKGRCRALGFHTLDDICTVGSQKAVRPALLGPTLYRELVDFLSANRVLHSLAD